MTMHAPRAGEIDRAALAAFSAAEPVPGLDVETSAVDEHQLETSALQQLARTAAHDRYRPLRWRAASAPRPEGTHTAAIPGTPPWMSQMLSWLAEQPA